MTPFPQVLLALLPDEERAMCIRAWTCYFNEELRQQTAAVWEPLDEQVGLLLDQFRKITVAANNLAPARLIAEVLGEDTAPDREPWQHTDDDI